MTTETQQQNDTTPDASPVVEDTALAAAAASDTDNAGDAGGSEEGQAEAAAAEAPAGAPEAYDVAAFQLPEGIEFDTAAFEPFEPVLRELNLSQEQAGKLVGVYAEKLVPLIQQRTAEQFDNQAAELRANLARDLQADPEVGGKKLDESRSYAAKAIAHFIPKAEERSEFSTFLNESGLGNHPLLMRLVAGSGRVLAEASTPTAETAQQPLTESQKFYGKKG